MSGALCGLEKGQQRLILSGLHHLVARVLRGRRWTLTETSRCLFCRAELNVHNRSLEHLIASSMGGAGWLTTHEVCKACNDVLGHEVDSIANLPVLHALRQHADLKTPPLRLKYFDTHLGRWIEGVINPDNTLTETTSVIELGDGVRALLGPDEDSVAHLSERMRAAAEDRGHSWVLKQAGRRDHLVGFRAHGRKTPKDQLVRQLMRLHCKVTIEYIAIGAGIHSAMEGHLDDLRAYALRGAAKPPRDIAVRSREQFRLPSLRSEIWFDPAHGADPHAVKTEKKRRTGRSRATSIIALVL